MALCLIALENPAHENILDVSVPTDTQEERLCMVTMWMASLITTSFTRPISMKVVLSFPDA